MLGLALLGQSKFADGEQMLLQGHAGMLQREDKIPHGFKIRLTETEERLVLLYESWGKQDEAAKWRTASSSSRNPQSTAPPNSAPS